MCAEVMQICDVVSHGFSKGLKNEEWKNERSECCTKYVITLGRVEVLSSI